jgi:hypothetical protein
MDDMFICACEYVRVWVFELILHTQQEHGRYNTGDRSGGHTEPFEPAGCSNGGDVQRYLAESSESTESVGLFPFKPAAFLASGVVFFCLHYLLCRVCCLNTNTCLCVD